MFNNTDGTNLDRIAKALERIADAIEKSQKPSGVVYWSDVKDAERQ